MKNPILENYIYKLETSDKILGIWEQGSKVYGYSDQFSDEDYVIIWENSPPTKDVRTDLLNAIGAANIDIEDKPNKAQDKFDLNGTTFNTVHLSQNDDFFLLLDRVSKEQSNEDWLYRLGGFSRGTILYDPGNILKDYKNKMKITPEILYFYKGMREQSVKNNLSWLKTASEREQPIDFIKCLNFLLITLSVIQYLENGQFPLPVKWYEKEAEKYGWENNNLTEVVKLLKQDIPYKDISNLLNR